MKKIYKVKGQQFTTLAEVASHLGKSRVSQKDMDKYGVEVVTESSSTEAVATEAKVVKASSKSSKTTKKSEIVESSKSGGDNVGVKSLMKTLSGSTLEQSKSVFHDASNEVLIATADRLGLKTWEHMTHQHIRRMRVIMELKAHYYSD